MWGGGRGLSLLGLGSDQLCGVFVADGFDCAGWSFACGPGGRTIRTPKTAERADAPVEVTLMVLYYGAHARLGAARQRA